MPAANPSRTRRYTGHQRCLQFTRGRRSTKQRPDVNSSTQHEHVASWMSVGEDNLASKDHPVGTELFAARCKECRECTSEGPWILISLATKNKQTGVSYATYRKCSGSLQQANKHAVPRTVSSSLRTSWPARMVHCNALFSILSSQVDLKTYTVPWRPFLSQIWSLPANMISDTVSFRSWILKPSSQTIPYHEAGSYY